MLSSFALSWAENENVADGFSPLTTVAPWTVEAWNPALEEEVSQSDLAGPCLDENRALSLVESLVELKDVLVWRHLGCYRGSRCSVLLRLLPSLMPVSLLGLVCRVSS